MISKNFRINIIVQVILIALTGLLTVWSFTRENLSVARFTFFSLWIILIVYLIYYINTTNQTLKTFLESIRNLDSVRKKSGSGRVNRELDQLYDEIISTIRQVEIERESDRHFLKHLVEHIGVGIISFNEQGEVEIVNEAAKSLFSLKTIDHLSSLGHVAPEMPELLTTITPGQQMLHKLVIGNETFSLTLKVTGFRLLDRNIRLVSLQNIKSELEEEELDAWQKLIRVLTHEIMNSVTPVNSLITTIISMFEEKGKQKEFDSLDEPTIKNALEGLHSIEKRSKGLAAFVKSYRSLTKIRKPEYTQFSVKKLFQNIRLLEQHELDSRGIMLKTHIDPEYLKLTGDEKLVEQVLINLLSNSMQAMMQKAGQALIWLYSYHDKTHVIIETGDNGPGISEEIRDNIFIPFFTTKEDGSGIGLSLSRQIMRMHGGSISVRSKPQVETVFTIKFPLNRRTTFHEYN